MTLVVVIVVVCTVGFIIALILGLCQAAKED
jgi:preprotein translocase subunit Sss1